MNPGHAKRKTEMSSFVFHTHGGFQLLFIWVIDRKNIQTILMKSLNRLTYI